LKYRYNFKRRFTEGIGTANEIRTTYATRKQLFVKWEMIELVKFRNGIHILLEEKDHGKA
jgi:hypothetical protein